MNDNPLKAKEARLKAKIERIQKMFPNPTGKEAEQIEAALNKTEAQLREVQKELATSEAQPKPKPAKTEEQK